MHRLLASTGGRILVLGAAALLTFLLTALALRHGMKANIDAWLAWEGSVNLIEHHARTTMLGVPIRDWPPLYFHYLALCQRAGGQTGQALILAACFLGAANAAVWGAYVFRVFPREEGLSAGLLGSLVFLVCFLPLTCEYLSSNCLLLFFVGLALLALASVTEATLGVIGPALGLAVALGAALFTHNSAVVYIGAAILVILVASRAAVARRLTAIAVILIICAAVWLTVPHGLRASGLAADTPIPASAGQAGTHYLFHPMYGVSQYLAQLPVGMGVFFIPVGSEWVQGAVGVAVLAMALALFLQPAATPLEKRQRRFLGFILLAVAGHFVIFNLVFIDATLGGRFAWYAALALAPITICRFRQRTPVLVLLLLLSVGVSGWRLAKLVRAGPVPPLAAVPAEATDQALYPVYFLTSIPHAVVPRGFIQIEPPVFRTETSLPGQAAPIVHEAVTLLPDGSTSK